MASIKCVSDGLSMQHIEVTVRVLIETGTGGDGDGLARCTHTKLHVIVVVECVRKQRRNPNLAAGILHRGPKTVRLVEVCSLQDLRRPRSQVVLMM